VANKENPVMKKDLLTLAFLVLIACIVATVVFVIGERDRQDQGATPIPIVEILPTIPFTPSPQLDDTSTPAASLTSTPRFTATSTPCNPPAGWVLYTVQPGENLFRIAARYGMTAEELQQANCLSSADEILAGESLYVPWLITPSPTPCLPPSNWVLYTVQPGENLFQIARRYGMSAGQIQQANCLTSEQLVAGQGLHVPYLIPAPPVDDRVDTGPAGGAGGGEETAQRPQIIPGLREELYFEGGGGGDVPICDEPAPGTPLPAIVVSDRLLDMGTMCLYGFDLNDQVTVELYGPPDDHIVASEVVTIVMESEGRTEEVIFLWWPVGLPTGTWQAVARSTGGMMQSSFVIPTHEYMRISTAPAGEIDPFEMHFCDIYRSGDEVMIRGINFPANATFPVGVYQVTWTGDGTLESTGSLVHGRSVTTDGDGYFVTSVTVGPSDPPGDYYVIAMVDPNVNRYRITDAETGCYEVESE
jgi:LysM repeat protein